MKRGTLIVFLTAVVFMMSVDPSSAQSVRKYKFFAGGQLGFAVTPGQFTDYYVSGFGFNFGVEYPVSPNWSITGMFDLKLFSPAAGMIKDWWTDPDEYPLATNIDVSEGSLTAGTIAIVSKGYLRKAGDRLFPYIKGGFGITISGADEIKIAFDTPFVGRQVVWAAGVEARLIFQ